MKKIIILFIPAIILLFFYNFFTFHQQGYLAFFLNILNAGDWGMSILFTSPVFIWIFFSPWKRIEVKAASTASLTILFLILGYYGIGGWQYGYRYAVDLYPFLFIILLYSLKKGVTFMFSLVAILSFIINSYLIITSFRDPFKFF